MKIQRNKLASIIIVNFNNSKLLDECINSALNQTYKHKEIIVVDDYSTDNSLKILNMYKKNKNNKK